jgi:hypothetical protein
MKHSTLLVIIQSVAILLYACSSSATESALQETFGKHMKAAAPVFLSCSEDTPTEIEFQFSLPVTVVEAHFEPKLEIASIDNGQTVTFHLSTEVTGGEQITADILVEDEHKNTLNILVAFRSRNNRLPSFLITEIRTETSKPKGEFVELKMLSEGNLGALRMFIATDSMDVPCFEFSPVEVKKGEYVVIHLRTYEDGTVNETGTDLAASQGTDSQTSARDFWLGESKERLRKTDAVFFMDQDNNIIDAALFSEKPDTWGTNGVNLSKAAELLGSQGAWKPDVPAPSDAISSAATTTTRTICRDESRADTNSAADWYITASSSATPGKPNNTKRYAVK